jgi:osmotically-inducible protein OsmY
MRRVGQKAYRHPPTLSQPDWSITMIIRNTLAAIVAAVALLSATGCAVSRGQESVGAYVDDTAITTAVKAHFLENKEVDGTSIKVETLKGTVMLSGFAKNSTEKSTAESIARNTDGVKMVKNEIAVRP